MQIKQGTEKQKKAHKGLTYKCFVKSAILTEWKVRTTNGFVYINSIFRLTMDYFLNVFSLFLFILELFQRKLYLPKILLIWDKILPVPNHKVMKIRKMFKLIIKIPLNINLGANIFHTIKCLLK